jgi:MoaA/NifB/PqqE/SkfB family radical SAM enzyme
MEPATFKAILDGSAGWGSALRFIGWGEPLLNQNLVSFVSAAAQERRLTHLNTNGTLLGNVADRDGIVRRLFINGLSSIKVSFQGVDRESYRDMRSGDIFEDLVRVVEGMAAVRETLPSFGPVCLPFISVSTTITNETREQVDTFVKHMSKLCDRVTVGATTFDFIDRDYIPEKAIDAFDEAKKKARISRRHHPDPCPEVYDKLSVAWDGSIRVCCNDYSGVTNLGNVRDSGGLRSAWSHPTIVEYRKRLAEGRYEGPLCSVCYDYMGLTG